MTISNIFLKASESIVTNFHKELAGTEERKVCSNCRGHITNMATMPVHGKNL